MQILACDRSPMPASPVRKHIPDATLPNVEQRRAFSRERLRMLKQLLKSPIECQYDPAFDETDAEDRFLAPVPVASISRKSRRKSDDSGADLLASGDLSAFPTSVERQLFQRFNFCRYRMLQLLERFSGKTLTVEAAAKLIEWETLVRRTRAEIVNINVPLVLAMAKRTRVTSVDFSELISEGNMALLRSVDKFDCARGYKFSTYACRAILKSFSRAAVRSARYRGRFPTEFDPALERCDERRAEEMELECLDELKNILGTNMANLNEIERQVLNARFALDAPPASEISTESKTLEQVGEMIGVTKERVRQIQNKALSKLREALEAGPMVA